MSAEPSSSTRKFWAWPIAKLNNDDMGKGLDRADLRCGDGMVVLFQRPKPLEGDFIEREGATHQAFA
jgi:hypothetical protein